MEKRMEVKPPVEVRYKEELEALKGLDTGRRPLGWQLSPRAVRTFILGSREPLLWNGKEIAVRKKYLGNDALVERCIITLAGNRGLMLVGEPGTAKTMLSELLAAAISGTSLIPSRERRNHRGHDQIQLELRPSSGRRAQPAGAGSLASLCRHGAGDSDSV